MALNATRLRDVLVTAAKASYARAAGVAMSAAQETEAEAFWGDISSAILGELTGHAEVSVTVPVEPADAGLQSFIVATPPGTIPTTGPIAPTSLDGSGGVS